MLEVAEGAETATRNPPLSRAFFITQATLITVICWAQMLPTSPSRVVTIIGFLALVGVGMRWVFLRPGYGMVGLDGQGAFPYMVSMIAAVGLPAALAVALDATWLWLPAGVLGGVVTFEMGHRYRREVGSA
ncbi:hypothetical protein AC792_04055 [Arthrobacter sp. RIT-PI-e]|nr:hypothetical protein AC792_04055 [Arthrobacter sp. RIT-PI-e]